MNRWNRFGRLLLVTSLLVTAATLLLPPSPTPGAVAAPDTQSSGPGSTDDLLKLPPLSPATLASVQRVYRSGIEQGNSRNRFILIGDSNNEQPEFLQSFSYGNYDLGAHTYLQPMIDAYNATDAFGAEYPSSEHGMTMSMLMDPAFVNPAVCPQAANVLDCAIQQFKPGVAIIYMGTYDTCHTPFETYLESFHAAMQLMIERGVVPVLTTYTVAFNGGCWENTHAYTAVIRDMASTYQMPLIELGDYTEWLPDNGLEPDGWHLSYPNDHHTSFAGDEERYGNTLRELLTLQMLYMLRRDVMHATP